MLYEMTCIEICRKTVTRIWWDGSKLSADFVRDSRQLIHNMLYWRELPLAPWAWCYRREITHIII